MDLRIALSPVSVELPEHAPHAAKPPHSGACHKRRNDDWGSSFRHRDKGGLDWMFRSRNVQN
jgi:hypothetical protein